MNSNPRTSDARQQALDWLISKDSGTWSYADQRAFEAWLVADPTHREEYEAARALWQTLEQFKPHIAAQREAARRYRGAGPWYRSAWVPRLALGIAGAFVVAMGLQRWNVTTASYATHKGERQTVTLADGSTILLNTDTALEVRFAGDRRAVAMRRGEAFFSVVHEAKRPFEVVAGGGRIRDLGTRFNVYAQPERVAVAVLDGEIDVTTGQTRTPQALKAGQSISYDNAGELSSIGPVDVPAISAWQAGKLFFHDRPLSEVLVQVARYHSVELVLADPELKTLKISGTFNTNSLPLFLRTLEAGFPVKAEVLDGRHIRLRRARH